MFFDTCRRPHAMHMPKLLPRNAIQEKIQEKCKPEIHSNTAGTPRNSDLSPIYLGIPFFNGQCESKMSSSLESWFKPYLQLSLSLSLSQPLPKPQWLLVTASHTISLFYFMVYVFYVLFFYLSIFSFCLVLCGFRSWLI